MKKWLLFSLLAVLFASCDKEGSDCTGTSEKDFFLAGFSKVQAGDNFNIHIKKGSGFAIHANGCTLDIEDLRLYVVPGNVLFIEYKGQRRSHGKTDITITVPVLVQVALSGKATADITGFDDQATMMLTIMPGNAQCTVNGTAGNAQAQLSGASVLHLYGRTETLPGNVNGNTQLYAVGVVATEVEVSTSGTSKARVQPLETIFADASGKSKVYYRGNPSATRFNTSGNGRIIHN